MAFIETYVDFHPLPEQRPFTNRYTSNGTSRDHSHFLPPPGHHHHFIPPPPPPYFSSSPNNSSSLCPYCFLPFNPTMSYSGTCPNCTFKLQPPPPLPPSSALRNFPLQTYSSSLQPKKSTSSLSSSGSSSSSVTSPEFSNVDSFLTTTMLNVVDDILREEVPTCFHCDSPEPRLSYCLDCQKHLCTLTCVSLHSQDHHIVTNHLPYKHISSPPSLSSIYSSSYKETCDRHIGKPILYFCKPCLSTLCYDCISEGHQQHSHVTIKEAYRQIEPHLEPNKLHNKLASLDKSFNDIEKLKNDIIKNKSETLTNVQLLFQEQHEALARREKAVIAAVNSIEAERLEGLQKEKEDIEKTRQTLKDMSIQLKKRTNNSDKDSIGIVLTHYKLQQELNLKDTTSNIESLLLEDNSFIIKPNSTNIQTAIDSFCDVTTKPHPPFCTATGEGLCHPRTNQLSSVIVSTKDRMGAPCREGGESFLAVLNRTGQGGIPLEIKDNHDCTYTINFRPRHKGEHTLSITMRGHHIKGSPYQLIVEGEQDYGRVGMVSHVFGSEGSGPGEFCRPWGICCDQKGHIIIGDRSNHRVQVFDSNGTFLHMFGTEGKQTGQFNRPAGVAITRDGNIVVADKDNHRIQVFKLDGTFLFTFGRKGGKDGEMVYPYDVAVNPVDGRIVTTDTGNHRILIFNPEGRLLGKFGYKGYLCNHFDSPRGIAINHEGHIIVSDFNVHHVLVIHPDGTTARILGSQGTSNTQFMRPQGIAVDHSGNFIIADTRNNRVMIMHPSGHFIAKFGSPGSGRGQFDRPTTVAVLPDKRIAVMDFGNSRIQIFS